VTVRGHGRSTLVDVTGPSPRGVALSSLLQRAILLVTALAMLLFALPLAVVVGNLYRSQAQEHLARDAERARAVLDADVLARPQAIAAALPLPHHPRVDVGVYDGSGALIGGRGLRAADVLTRQAASTGVEEQGRVDDELVTVVPLIEDRDAPAQYVVRAAEPYELVQRDQYLTWGLMAALALVVLAVVAGLGRSRAHRIARPLQHLARSAEALGQGDFSVRAARSGVSEVDAASLNLERTARRLGGMLERERAFSADASHQLRTPLTAVRIGLESALITAGSDLRRASEEALEDLDRLEQTVLDLLALARDTRRSTEATDVADLVSAIATPWAKRLREAGRSLRTSIEDDVARAAVSAPALRTVLDVLLDNALVHGGGQVMLAVRGDEHTVTVEVGDQGEGLPASAGGGADRIFTRRSAQARGTGIGLALARSLMEADGGRLEVTSRRPAVFAAVLPAVTGEDPGEPLAADAEAAPATRPPPTDPAQLELTSRPGGS